MALLPIYFQINIEPQLFSYQRVPYPTLSLNITDLSRIENAAQLNFVFEVPGCILSSCPVSEISSASKTLAGLDCVLWSPRAGQQSSQCEQRWCGVSHTVPPIFFQNLQKAFCC